MTWSRIQDIADEKVLHLTTIGRRTGVPRELEIWFVVYRDRFYLFAETGEAAAWVKNVRRNREVVVRIAERQISARARVLDRELWDQVAAIHNNAQLSRLQRRHRLGKGFEATVMPERDKVFEVAVKYSGF